MTKLSGQILAPAAGKFEVKVMPRERWSNSLTMDATTLTLMPILQAPTPMNHSKQYITEEPQCFEIPMF